MKSKGTKKKAHDMTADEMMNRLPENCRNSTMMEICGMFLESRQEIGFPFTERSLSIMINKYKWTDESLAAALLCSIERGWRGVFMPDPRSYAEYSNVYRNMMTNSKDTSPCHNEQFQQQPQEKEKYNPLEDPDFTCNNEILDFLIEFSFRGWKFTSKDQVMPAFEQYKAFLDEKRKTEEREAQYR